MTDIVDRNILVHFLCPKRKEESIMPATHFICPDGRSIPIMTCLNNCPNKERCMFLPTIRAIAVSSDRKLNKPSVTELISGTREIYLKRTTEYAIDPFSTLLALHGQAVHYMN